MLRKLREWKLKVKKIIGNIGIHYEIYRREIKVKKIKGVTFKS